jgi:hypothetical protein
MERKSNRSSSLLAVDYIKDCSILEITDSKGHLFRYYDVPEHLYTGLLNSHAKDNFLETRIRQAGFQRLKLR